MTGSVFKRGEVALAHTVYGLILTLATVGELINEEVTAGVAVAWLLGAGAVLLGAHLFSDMLAHVATTRDEPDWFERSCRSAARTCRWSLVLWGVR